MEAGLRKKRKLSPDHWYLNKPELPWGTEFLTMAYRDLVTCRSADGPIPWDKVALYAERKGLQPDTADLLWEVIRRMDVTERRWFLDNPVRAGGSDA